MIRSSVRSLRSSSSAIRQPSRVVSLNIRRGMAEGDTGSGSSRAGGAASGDAFTRREKSNEDMYMKEKEREKLKELKDSLAKQRAHLDELDKHIKDLSKDQGGEQN